MTTPMSQDAERHASERERIARLLYDSLKDRWPPNVSGTDGWLKIGPATQSLYLVMADAVLADRDAECAQLLPYLRHRAGCISYLCGRIEREGLPTDSCSCGLAALLATEGT
jgi:hypothetical protein